MAAYELTVGGKVSIISATSDEQAKEEARYAVIDGVETATYKDGKARVILLQPGGGKKLMDCTLSEALDPVPPAVS